MATISKKYSRTRTSKKYCQEKFCCKTENSEAFFHCEDCGANQCKDCEEAIHKESVKFEFHDRLELVPPPDEELCQIKKVQPNVNCVESNYADLRCEICQYNFCFTCFDIFHKGSKKTHRKIFFREFKQRQLQEKLNNPIRPSNPLEINDNSLTFMSCPQPQDNTTDQPATYLSSEQDHFHSDSMNSFTSAKSDHSQPNSIPDLCLSAGNEMSNTSIEDQLAESVLDIEDDYDMVQSFMLINDQEVIQIDDEDEFVEKLGCDKNELVKVVSIFGNTGDGKSFTLNHTFFGGKEVFETSAHQSSCTIGVWAAYDPKEKVITVDTEGLLGITSNQNQRMRLLLKILGISDIVIYRTRAERLHNDMYQFLCDSSSAYTKHFSEELQVTAQKCNKTLADLAPALIIFHETVNTKILGYPEKGKNTAEKFIWDTFRQLQCTMHFKDLTYIGTQTPKPPTDFSKFKEVMSQHLADKSHRAARQPSIVFKTLKNLNDKFNGEVEKPLYGTFPDQLFSCSKKCLSCGEGCTRSMNHDTDYEPHETDRRCKYQHQYENKIYLCKACYLAGKEHIVIPKTSESKDNAWTGLVKYVWSGEVLECPSCGVIFRSRQNWYGNKDVEEVVHTEIRHVWPDGYQMLQGTNNAARKVIDGFHYIADSITSVGSKPTKMISDWVNDQIAPEYWIPNSQITHCHSCSKELENEQKHHCRACGRGFCDDCTSKKRKVPERGWGEMAVRVCDRCHGGKTISESNESTGNNSQVTARKVGEVVTSALNVAASTLNYPIGMIKDTARPGYWIPDEQIKVCYVCNQPFGPKLWIHHCRACGNGVCELCSPNKRAVPLRGWDYPVRICKKCENKRDHI